MKSIVAHPSTGPPFNFRRRRTAGLVGVCPPKAKVTRSNRVGCARFFQRDMCARTKTPALLNVRAQPAVRPLSRAASSGPPPPEALLGKRASAAFVNRGPTCRQQPNRQEISARRVCIACAAVMRPSCSRVTYEMSVTRVSSRFEFPRSEFNRTGAISP